MNEKLLILVLNKIDTLDALLLRLNEAGVHGATVINSTGMAHALASHEENLTISSFRAFFAHSREENRTVFMVLSEEKIAVARSVIREVVGDLSLPNTGILFSLPVDFFEGLTN